MNNRNNRSKIDLHMHSNASDGIFSPRELMRIASNAGLAAAGLTDHDTIKGLPEALSAAKIYDLELVPGVEISVMEDNREVHILGYYPSNSKLLHKALEELQKERFVRMEKILKNLKELGFKIKTEELLAETGDSAPGRLHLARLLLKKKYIHTLDQAFTLYLNPDCAAYVPRQTMTAEQAMNLLNAVEALPVIAHPGDYGRAMIEKLLPLGLRGIEVFHPHHGPAQKNMYHEIALEHKLLITGGSDFHGDEHKYSQYPQHLAISGHYLQPIKNCIID